MSDQAAVSLPDRFPSTGLRPFEVVRILGRNALPVLFLGLLFAALGYIAPSYLTKQYTATAQVVISTESFAIPELQGATSDPITAPLRVTLNEMQILKSPALIQAVIDDLKLGANPEFNPSHSSPGPQTSLSAWLQDEISGLTGEKHGLTASDGKSELAAQSAVRNSVLDAVLERLIVSTDGRSLVISIQFSSEDPALAARTVNTLIQRYNSSKVEGLSEVNREAGSTLRSRLQDSRGEIDALDSRIEQTRKQYNIVQTSAGSVGQQQLEDLSSALVSARTDRASLEANYARTLAMARGGSISPDSADSSTIARLRDRAAEASRRVAQLSTALGPDHPARRAAEAERSSSEAAIKSEAQRLAAALGAQVQAARDREAKLLQQLASAQAKASGVAVVQAELKRLEKDADAARLRYERLLQNTERTDDRGPKPTTVQVVHSAQPPLNPSRPRPKLSAAIGLISGLTMGGCIGLFRNRELESFFRPDEVAEETGLDVIASVPRLSAGERARGLAATVLVKRDGAQANAVRLIRSRLRFRGRSSVPTSVLFVSSTSGEGASSVAAAFARVAALEGLRVLLVAGDVRSPSLGQMLQLPRSNGIVEALAGEKDWREAIVADPHSKLECLVAEGPTLDASMLMETSRLHNLMAEARDYYNLVVIDGPPVASATHSLILTHVADAVVLVLSRDEVSRRDVHFAAKALLGSTRSQPVIVINKA